MNWTKAVIAGVLGGIAVTVADFVMHGKIMGNTYTQYDLFSQEQANPIYFALIAICIGITVAFLFAKTRGSWGAGAAGGATFGFWFGLASFFPSFYNALVLEGFPYYLSWCWGGIVLIDSVILGAVLGLMYKES